MPLFLQPIGHTTRPKRFFWSWAANEWVKQTNAIRRVLGGGGGGGGGGGEVTCWYQAEADKTKFR